LVLAEADDLLLSNWVEQIEIVASPLDFLLTGGISLHLRTIRLIGNTKELKLAQFQTSFGCFNCNFLDLRDVYISSSLGPQGRISGSNIDVQKILVLLIE
jgi:hypothetical protein